MAQPYFMPSGQGITTWRFSQRNLTGWYTRDKSPQIDPKLTLLGEPDFGLLTQTEVVSAAQRICSVIDIPVIVDADTGYGNAINVIRTVRDLIRAGAGGMFLEDQIWPKRCGHMRGKQVISLEEQLNKLRAAVEAKGRDDFFIVARTDAHQALGVDEAIKRGIAFKNAGADAVFIEAPESKDEMARNC